MRRLHSLYRRRYSVEDPQHLWHIDGKLYILHFSMFQPLCCFIPRWRLVIHGGVDGYSRMIVYLRCNRAVTVLQLLFYCVHISHPLLSTI